jgi:quinolinate synthase
MAETAKILNPERIVVVPDMAAGCSLADGCPADRFARVAGQAPGRRRDHLHQLLRGGEGARATTSARRPTPRRSCAPIPADKEILFAPDRNLGRFSIEKTGRPMLLWQGSCIVHETFSERKHRRPQGAPPDAKLIAHPECEEPILRMADFVGSTTALLKYTISRQREEVHRRHRDGIVAPDEEGLSAEGVHRGPARGQLLLQRVPVHEAQHAREGLPGAARLCSLASRCPRSCGSARGSPSTGCSR